MEKRAFFKKAPASFFEKHPFGIEFPAGWIGRRLIARMNTLLSSLN